jgi:predicted amino acid racemase
MFLEKLLRRNPNFMSAAVSLHQSNKIEANSYVIDLDTVTLNSKMLKEKGDELGLDVIAMTKQVGRNPDFCEAVKAGGIIDAVAVDFECAVYSRAAGLNIAHLGHLVQIPKAQIKRGIELEPKLWTIFNIEQAHAISKEAVKSGVDIGISLRVWNEECTFYKGHEGGIHENAAVEVASLISRLPNLSVLGVTSFPALLFDKEKNSLSITANARLISKVAKQLEDLFAHEIVRNMPGTTSVAGMELLASAGASQVEPGHGLTGTTPLSYLEETPEIPAIAYVSEVAHHHMGRAYVFGGGLYRDPVLGEIPTFAAVISPHGKFETHEVDMPNLGAIDYYAILSPSKTGYLPPVGTSVIFGFRPQVFVTRGLTVGIKDVGSHPVALKHYGASGANSLVKDGE